MSAGAEVHLDHEQRDDDGQGGRGRTADAITGVSYPAGQMMLIEQYKSLWNRIHADGVWVRYDGVDVDEAGSFAHDGCGGEEQPEIQISRPFHGEPEDEPSEWIGTGEPADIKSELLTLAHEYGHFLSWNGETPRDTWSRYHAAVLRKDTLEEKGGRERVVAVLSDAEKQLICEEETLAWKLGRPFVPEELLAVYEEKARIGLHHHRYRLGLDELWPEDGP